jgi:hypothetical protein
MGKAEQQEGQAKAKAKVKEGNQQRPSLRQENPRPSTQQENRRLRPN